jgi:arsenite methyltransferase
MAAEPDAWSRWLLERRDGGNEHQRETMIEHLAVLRDRVLDNAEPLNGARLLDVGTGDGLIGLEALERVGPTGHVIFSDVSSALLEHARATVDSRGATDRATFVLTGAQELAAIPDASVDVIVTRSVLMYVLDKAQAFSAMLRALRGGGRVSLFEPINRLMFPEPEGRFWGYDVSAVTELAAKVKAEFTRREAPAATATMMDFDDRDLAQLAHAAGFERVHVECHIDLEPGSIMRSVSLSALLDSAPNPLAPTLREAAHTSLSRPEQHRFLSELEHAIADGRCQRRSAAAYLTAQKTP